MVRVASEPLLTGKGCTTIRNYFLFAVARGDERCTSADVTIKRRVYPSNDAFNSSNLTNLGRRLDIALRTRRGPSGAIQKRKRTPTVGSMLLCCKKPNPNPPCTWLNIMPK
jgi:hypothetical protein